MLRQHPVYSKQTMQKRTKNRRMTRRIDAEKKTTATEHHET